MEAIEAELESKTIERDVEVNEVIEPHEVIIEEVQPEPEPAKEKPKKVKKPRSEKQIAAFEKAKQKRAEGIALRKQQKEDAKIEKKELKKKVVESFQKPIVQEKPVSKPVIHAPHPREQVVNNYYYYGTGPPQPQHTYTETIEKKSRKKARPPTPSSSESESESEEEEQPREIKRQPPKPSLKFRFA